MPAAHFFAKDLTEIGLDAQKVQALFERAERDVREGLIPACQVSGRCKPSDAPCKEA
jgi:hypothetical protein